LHQDFNDENVFCLIGAWNNSADLKKHLNNKNYEILLGAMRLLSDHLEINYHDVSDSYDINHLPDLLSKDEERKKTESFIRNKGN
jgi:hypothetical protein